MKASPFTAQQQRIADLLEENTRNRWLVRNGHRAYGETAQRVVVGVHPSPRPSERARRRANARADIHKAGRPSSLLGTFGLIALFIAASWLAVFGLIWLAIQVLLWVGNLVRGIV